MFYDGLQSPFDGKLMGVFAEATAGKYSFSYAARAYPIKSFHSQNHSRSR